MTVYPNVCFGQNLSSTGECRDCSGALGLLLKPFHKLRGIERKEKRMKTLTFAKGLEVILQCNISVKQNSLSKLQGVYEVIISFPMSLDVLFLSLPCTTSDLLSNSLCCSFVWLWLL